MEKKATKDSPKKSAVKKAADTTAAKIAASHEGSIARTKKENESVKAVNAGKSKKTPVDKEPQTMDELLASTGYQLPVLKKGQLVEGKILSISGREILIDVSGKTVGVVGNREWEEIASYVKTLKVGVKVTAYVISPESESGQIVLSLRSAAWTWRWDRLEKEQKEGGILEVRGVELNKGGLIVDFNGMRGFIPGSQLSSKWLSNMPTLINRVLKVKVLELNRKQNRLVFSERLVGEVVENKTKQILIKQVKSGIVYKGVVSGIVNYGLFVSIKPEVIIGEDKAKTLPPITLDGLVHISEIAWEKVEDLPSLYRLGDEVLVKVLGLEKGTNKLNLSIKETKTDPWLELIKDLKKGKTVSGLVSRINSYGVLVQLGGGVDGLIHITQIPPNKQFKVGEEIKCTIDEINTARRRISLMPILKIKPVLYR